MVIYAVDTYCKNLENNVISISQNQTFSILIYSEKYDIYSLMMVIWAFLTNLCISGCKLFYWSRVNWVEKKEHPCKKTMMIPLKEKTNILLTPNHLKGEKICLQIIFYSLLKLLNEFILVWLLLLRHLDNL